MNCENYLRFLKAFAVFRQHPELHIQSVGQTWEYFEGNIATGLVQAKIFEIDDEMKKMLILTKTPNKNDDVKLPFPYVFLDVNFKKEELAQLGIKVNTDEIIGILMTKGNLVFKSDCNKTDIRFKHIPSEVGTSLRISMFSEQGGEAWWDSYNTNVNLLDEVKDMNIDVQQVKTSDKKARDFVHLFCLNFLNFLHNPEVEYIQHIRSEKNLQRKEKQGKIAIKESYSIKISGVLKKYVDEIRELGHFDGKYSYRFWCRGHFRTLRHPRYKENVGKKRWIFPYVKGKGVLIEKFYKIEEKNVY
jgi:hypothetical protein